MKEDAKLRVLVIEENGPARKYWVEKISEQYAETQWGIAADLTQAIRAIHSDPWDLALLGLEMPAREGLIVLKYVRADFPQIPIIVLSPQPEEFMALRVLKLGVSSFLRRDCTATDLFRAVEAALKGRKYFTPGVADLLLKNIVWNETGPTGEEGASPDAPGSSRC